MAKRAHSRSPSQTKADTAGKTADLENAIEESKGTILE